MNESGPLETLEYQSKNDFNAEKVQNRLYNKYPKLFRSILVLTAVVGGYTLKNKMGYNSGPVSLPNPIKIENGDDFDNDLEQIADKEFVQLVKTARAELKTFVNGIPSSASYDSTVFYETLNGKVNLNAYNHGELSDEDNNIIVGNAGIFKKVTRSNNQESDELKSNFYTGHTSGFYVTRQEKRKLEATGTKIEKGEGSTKAEALQNALESAVSFAGIKINSETTHDNHHRDENISTGLGDSIETRSQCLIKHYKIVDDHVDETPEGPRHHVTLEVQFGSQQAPQEQK